MDLPAQALQSLIDAFNAEDPNFIEVAPEVYDYYLKADVLRAEKQGAFLLGDCFADIEVLGQLVGVYPAFYCVQERCFGRMETLEVFEKGASVHIIESQFSLALSRPFEAMTKAFQDGDRQFFETTEQVYDEQLNCLPPILMNRTAFLAGEPALHTQEGSREVPVYSAFYRVDGRYFCRLETPSTYVARQSLAAIRQQFNLY